jgi:ATP-dependent helicase HepA
LTRVRFLPDDKIEIEGGNHLTVKSVTEEQGLLRYHALTEDGNIVLVDEMELSHHLQFNKPQDKLFIGQVELGRWFSLRYQTYLLPYQSIYCF